LLQKFAAFRFSVPIEEEGLEEGAFAHANALMTKDLHLALSHRHPQCSLDGFSMTARRICKRVADREGAALTRKRARFNAFRGITRATMRGKPLISTMICAR